MKKKLLLLTVSLMLCTMLTGCTLVHSDAYREVKSIIKKIEANGFTTDEIAEVQQLKNLKNEFKGGEYDYEFEKNIMSYYYSANTLEKLAEIGQQFGIYDFKFCEYTPKKTHIDMYFSSENFVRLDNSAKLNLLSQLQLVWLDDHNYNTYHSDALDSFYILSGDNRYIPTVNDGAAWLIENDEYIYSEKNDYSEYILAELDKVYGEKEREQYKKDHCPVCGGTGQVRYYYGASALEAFLAGEADYQYGPCPYCR